MQAIPRHLMVGFLTVAAVGLSSAPATADSECQDVGGAVVCAYGNVAGDPSQDVPFGPLPTLNDLNSSACTNQYGTYQNCNGR